MSSRNEGQPLLQDVQPLTPEALQRHRERSESKGKKRPERLVLDEDRGPASGVPPVYGGLGSAVTSANSRLSRASTPKPGPSVPPAMLPGDLSDKDELQNPLVKTAPVELNPRDIGTKFFTKYGSKEYEWRSVIKVTSVPFAAPGGQSEAKLYHAVLEMGSGEIPSSPFQMLLNKMRSEPTSPTAKRGSSLRSPLQASISAFPQHGSGAFSDTENAGALSLDDMPLHETMPSVPPAMFIIKHYDTNEVNTSSMALRLVRHLTDTTTESMIVHEVYFYTKIAPFLRHPSCPFRVPRVYFVASLDRGEPGFLKYVCCKSGSGSVASIGLEDMSRSGYSFEHEQDDGIYDEECITAVLVGLAHLHSQFFGRCAEDVVCEVDPAPIPRCVHRCGNAIVDKLGQLRKTNLHTTVFRRWQKYPPMKLLKCDEVKRTLVQVQRRWKALRDQATTIVMTNDTVVHGDCHYRNVAFKRRVSETRRRRGHGDEIRRLRSVDTIASVTEEDYLHGPPTATPSPTLGPWSSHLGRPLNVEAAFLDFQSAGRGSLVSEVLYFICSSVPVEVTWEEVDYPNSGSEDAMHLSSSLGNRDPNSNGSFVSNVSFSRKRSPSPMTGSNRTGTNPNSSPGFPSAPSSSPSLGGPKLPNSADSERSTGTAVPNQPSSTSERSTESSDVVKTLHNSANEEQQQQHPSVDATSSSGVASTGRSPNTSVPAPPPAGQLLSAPPQPQVTVHTSSTSMSFRELYEYDVGLLAQYHSALEPAVQEAYPLQRLVSEAYTLARHWAGTLLIDMVSGSVEERLGQKKRLDMFRLLEWSEQMARRVIWMCTAAQVYEEEERAANGESGGEGSVSNSEAMSLGGYSPQPIVPQSVGTISAPGSMGAATQRSPQAAEVAT